MKIALVTGGAKGLGLAWCRHLGKAGYSVILTGRDEEKVNEASMSLQSEGLDIHSRVLDVQSEKDIKELAEWTKRQFGQIDLLINNAGVNPKDYSDKTRMAKAFYLNELDAAEMLEVIHINSLAPLMMVKHFRALLKNSRMPLVINISSWLGSVSNLSFGGHYGYVGSKNLLNVLNKSMANELQADGIICINVNPGWVRTDMGGKNGKFSPEEAVENIYRHVVIPALPLHSGKFLNYDGSEHPW